MEMQSHRHSVETHEQFLQRASGVFPVDSSLAWTAFERAVFNHLMARLIFRHGYAGVSDAMLRDAYDEMQDIVRRCASDAARDRMH